MLPITSRLFLKSPDYARVLVKSGRHGSGMIAKFRNFIPNHYVKNNLSLLLWYTSSHSAKCRPLTLLEVEDDLLGFTILGWDRRCSRR